MDPQAMEPQGRALRAYYDGDLDAELIIHRDDGVVDSLPVRHFFRNPSEFTGIETSAIDLCSGHVLDAAAGTGLHSLVLQQLRGWEHVPHFDERSHCARAPDRTCEQRELEYRRSAP